MDDRDLKALLHREMMYDYAFVRVVVVPRYLNDIFEWVTVNISTEENYRTSDKRSIKHRDI